MVSKIEIYEYSVWFKNLTDEVMKKDVQEYLDDLNNQ